MLVTPLSPHPPPPPSVIHPAMLLIRQWTAVIVFYSVVRLHVTGIELVKLVLFAATGLCQGGME